MIDLHSHIIPNLDDGAASFTEAEMMAQDAVDGGTSILVATPHYFNKYQCLTDSSRAYVTEQFDRLRERLAQAQIPLEIRLGAEIYAGSDFEKILEDGQLLTLAKTQYVLVEFDFSEKPPRVMSCIEMLKDYGAVPVIAHPERYEYLQGNSHFIYKLIDCGCVLQVNKGSPLGGYGKEVQVFSQWLLRNRLTHVIASDCHSPYRRTANMENAHRWLSMHLSDEYVSLLFEDNPRSIINGERVTL